MDFLPVELENILLDYKSQLEHVEKYKKCLNKIKTIIMNSYFLHQKAMKNINTNSFTNISDALCKLNKGYTYSVGKISEKPDVHEYTFCTYGDLLNCISLKNYDIGDSFDIYYGGHQINHIELTEDNINNLFTPYPNKEINMISNQYKTVRILCLNREMNREIDIYYTLAEINLRKMIAFDFPVPKGYTKTSKYELYLKYI